MPTRLNAFHTSMFAAAAVALLPISTTGAQTQEELLQQMLQQQMQASQQQSQELLDSMKTTTLLNCGRTRENSRSVYGTESAGDMAVYDADCGNERKFGYQDTITIVLEFNGVNVVSKVGNKHYGCHAGNADAAKDASNVIKNANSNYVLVHRPNKNLTEAVAIPKDVGLGCNQITKNATPYNRYRKIQ